MPRIVKVTKENISDAFFLRHDIDTWSEAGRTALAVKIALLKDPVLSYHNIHGIEKHGFFEIVLDERFGSPPSRYFFQYDPEKTITPGLILIHGLPRRIYVKNS